MATLGPNDLKQYAVPSNWDAGRLTAIRLETGETYDQLLSDIADGLALANQAIQNDPLISGLVSVQTDAAVEQRVGVSNGFQPHTEYGQPDAGRGKTTGWMLPMNPFDRKLGWTWDFLRKARRAQIDADIASAIDDWKNLWQKTILTRLFKSTYDSVGTGKSVPVADGGTADSAYVPIHNPARASAFASTHTHLLNGAGVTQANLETAVKHLWEHGADGPFDLLASVADAASWSNTTNVTGYVKRADGAIRYGTQTDLANVASDYAAVIETIYGVVRVRYTGRVPTNYWSVYKSYGPFDQRNPLVVRQSPQYGTSAVLLPGEFAREYPLENALLFAEFGAGVRDRVGAALWYVNAGAYTTPTIS